MSEANVSAETRLSDEEFMRRLRVRLVERGGEGADAAADAADIDMWRDNFENDPEGAADEEMSYWDDDGDE